MPMMMTAAGTIAGGQGVRDGRRRRRPAGHRHRQAPGRHRHRHRRAPRHQGAGGKPGRHVRRGEDEEFKNAQTAGGYAKEMSKEYQAKQAALTAEHIKKQDIVITTALIPGRKAPMLVTEEMVEVDEAGLGDRRPGGRARRQCRGRQAGRSRRRRWRHDHGLHQSAGPRRGVGLGALCPQPVQLRRALVDKKTKALAVELGRRDRQGAPR